MARRSCFIVWFVLSASPLVCGWYAVDGLCLISNFAQRSCHHSLVRRLSLSETMLRGSPWIRKMFQNIKSAVSCALSILLVVMKCTILVARSVTVSTALKVWLLRVTSGRPTTQSMLMDCHLRVGKVKYCRRPCSPRLSGLTAWQVGQVFTNSATNWRMWGSCTSAPQGQAFFSVPNVLGALQCDKSRWLRAPCCAGR